MWNVDLGYEEIFVVFEISVLKFGLDYLDLYFIYWFVEGKYKEVWRVFEMLYKEGCVKVIGVSNF